VPRAAGTATARQAERTASRAAEPTALLGDADAIDFEAPEYRAVDWDRLPRHAVELDPALVEHIRARSRLRQITLRVGEEQIAEAQRVATVTGEKYQAVMRRWLAAGASRDRAERLQVARKRKPAR
jgi:hypothetical protein